MTAGSAMAASLLILALPGQCEVLSAGRGLQAVTDDRGRLTTIGEAHATGFGNFLMQGKTLGDVVLRVRTDGGEWREERTDGPDSSRHVVAITSAFRSGTDSLVWDITLRNTSDRTAEVGDVALPFLFAMDYEWDVKTTYERRVVRHSLVAGDNSWAYWQKPTGEGPILLMTPLPGTRLEYFRRTPMPWYGEGLWTAFVHAKATATERESGRWRLPLTSVTLTQSGTDGDTARYGFRFEHASSAAEVRNILARRGLLDVQVVPGMTVPTDLPAMVAVRSSAPIHAVTSEFPGETSIEEIGSKAKDARLYRVGFRRTGENLLTVRYGDGRVGCLEFYVTEPIETLIKKRAAFVAKQQVRDPSKWYDGLFQQYDMAAKEALTPDHPGPAPYYAVCGADDPGLAKAPFLIAKNLVYPNRDEVRAVEYYLEHFSWGKQQRTDEETPHPYGIYGSDSWRANRDSDKGLDSGGIGQERMWRTFDYTHVIQLYVNLYRLAKLYPEFNVYPYEGGYLKRALGTAQAYFSVPYNIKMGPPWSFRGWCDWAYKQGNFDEVFLLTLMDALNAEGMTREAAWLRGEWEKKVKYFVLDSPYPFGSEMKFDTTAFESTHVVANWALEHPLKPDFNLWYDKNEKRWYSHPSIPKGVEQRFMERQMAANVAARGWLETAWWNLGADMPNGANTWFMLRYMTTLGGWPVLDYGLRHAKDPYPYIRLGYASLLASWALVNSGEHPWFPGAQNDGAAGWVYGVHGDNGMGGIEHPEGRGPMRIDGESENTYSGYMRYATTVLVNDPLFGLFCYGGDAKTVSSGWLITPRDGVRKRLQVMNSKPRLALSLERDRLRSVRIEAPGGKVRRIELSLENATGTPHTLRIATEGLTAGAWSVKAGSAAPTIIKVTPSSRAILVVNLSGAPAERVVIARNGSG